MPEPSRKGGLAMGSQPRPLLSFSELEVPEEAGHKSQGTDLLQSGRGPPHRGPCLTGVSEEAAWQQLSSGGASTWPHCPT